MMINNWVMTTRRNKIRLTLGRAVKVKAPSLHRLHLSVGPVPGNSTASRPCRNWPSRSLLDFEQTVVLSQSFRLSNRSVFELVRAPSDRQIGRPVVFRLPAANAQRD